MSYYYTEREQASNYNRYLIIGIIFSLLIHILIVLVLNNRNPPLENRSKVFEVALVPELAQKNQQPINNSINQIVSPSDKVSRPEELSANVKRFLSHQDGQVEKEIIKRGDAPDAGSLIGKVAPPTKAQIPAKPSQAKYEASNIKKEPPSKVIENNPLITKQSSNQLHPLGNLRLDDKTLLEKFSSKEKSNDQQQSNSAAEPPPSYEAFSRPPGSGAAILGIRGSNDYLPNLPDGDLTLLNTKATQYAVFVRRVATQVFGQMRRSGWESLQSSDIMKIDSYSTVHAILNQKGDLISAKIEVSSGSPRFDDVLLAAVKYGARDPNPPEGAKAHDGLYHFIFKSQSWSRMAHNARNGAPLERRWLLLATGLE